MKNKELILTKGLPYNPKMFSLIGAAALAFTVLLLSVISACKNDRFRQHRPPVAGICISFDDYSVDEWFSLRALFLRYNARVTFFVTKFDTLSAEQVQKLRVLQSDGHEIAFHGAKHLLSEHYIKAHSMDEYLQEEVIKGIRIMADSGFRTTSFAYPYSAKYWFTDHQLLNYFYVLRSSLPLKEEPDMMDAVFYKFDGGRLIDALCIDKGNGWTTEKLARAMLRAKQRNEALILFGHQPGLTFDVAFLEEILKKAQQHELTFLRVTDLVV